MIDPARIEVGDQALVVAIPLVTLGDLGIDLGIAYFDALGVGHLGQHEQRLGAFLGVRSEVGVQVVARLLDRLEIGLLADALSGGEARNSSCITSTSGR